jgi:hypothetical protein
MKINELKDQVDDYEHTVHAIIGFINFYRFSDREKRMRPDTYVFQGMRLYLSEPRRAAMKNPPDHLTPDIAICRVGGMAVIAEVKKSFPSNQEFWWSDFEQLLNYDDDLRGWPTTDTKVPRHDIVLLTHQSRAAAVKKFLDKNAEKIKFSRPFSIIEFNRSDERQPYIFFRKYHGTLAEPEVNVKLEEGVSVPMHVFVNVYSKVKFYDAPPPLPYMLNMIWTHVVLPAASKQHPAKLPLLRKGQQVDVTLRVDEIADRLHEAFSYRNLNAADYHQLQPQLPKREWILEGCRFLVSSKEAAWVDLNNSELTFFFRRYVDVLNHFIDMCSQSPVATSSEPTLFG